METDKILTVMELTFKVGKTDNTLKKKIKMACCQHNILTLGEKAEKQNRMFVKNGVASYFLTKVEDW